MDRKEFHSGIQAPLLEALAELPDPMVFDVEGKQKDLAWLDTYWGVPVDIRRAALDSACDQVIRVTRIDVRQGPATQMVKVVSGAGAPLPQVAVARWWQDAPNIFPYPADCHATRWRQNGDIGWTNENGDVGYGVGQGDKPGSSGLWPIHCDAPSDGVFGLGMRAERNHELLAITFALLPVGEPVPGPDPEPPPADVADEIRAHLTTIGHALIAIEAAASTIALTMIAIEDLLA
jgi:hypothetical protein